MYANFIHATSQFESLLGDGFALDSSAINNKELSSAVLPEVNGASHILIECPVEFAEGAICLVAHCWYKDGLRRVGLGIDLAEELQPHEEGDT